MIELQFTQIPKKMWPGYSPEILLERVGKIGGSRSRITYKETTSESEKSDSKEQFVRSPILDSQGRLRGTFYSIAFCEKAFRDQLKSTTRFGNFWNGFRFLTSVFFFALVIVLSGGANPQMDTLSVLELFGAWSIMEIAFNRGLITSFKYSGIGETLGIRLRLIVIGAYSTVWLEILVLLGTLNTWSIYNNQSVLTFVDYFQIFSCLFLLLTLSLPFSLLVSMLSRNKIDLRYVFPVFFKFLVFTTPLFSTFHNNFPLIQEILKYSPLSYCFSFVIGFDESISLKLSSYFVCLILGYLFFFCVKEKMNPLTWKRSSV